MLQVIKCKIGSRKQWTDKSSLWQPGTKRKTQEQLQEANTNSIPKLMLHVRYASKRIFLLMKVGNEQVLLNLFDL